MFFAFIICKWHRKNDFECRFFDTHFSFTSFDNLSDSFCYRIVTFSFNRRILISLPGNEIINTCFLDFKSISTPCFSILINSLFRNFGKVYILQFKEPSAWLLLMFFVGRTSTLRYTELYPRATTSNSWRSFLRRIQVGFFVFCNVFHIFVM